MDYCTLFFFFFQAEDGIRDLTVTGVQTCALPISRLVERGDRQRHRGLRHGLLPVAGAPQDRADAQAASVGGDGRGRIDNAECGVRNAELRNRVRVMDYILDGRVFDSAFPIPHSALPYASSGTARS